MEEEGGGAAEAWVSHAPCGEGRAGRGLAPRGRSVDPLGPCGPGRRLLAPPGVLPSGTDAHFGLCSFSPDVSGRAVWKFKGNLGLLPWGRLRSPSHGGGCGPGRGVRRSPRHPPQAHPKDGSAPAAGPARTGLLSAGLSVPTKSLASKGLKLF